jgi:hypothetical protein
VTARQKAKLDTIIGKLEALQQELPRGGAYDNVSDAKSLLLRAQFKK